MLNDLNNYRVLYIPFGGLAGCWLYHGLYNKFQSIFKLKKLSFHWLECLLNFSFIKHSINKDEIKEKNLPHTYIQKNILKSIA